MPNPFAAGITLGGLLLDVVAPRPKPRFGPAVEPSLLSIHAEARTPRRVRSQEHDGSPDADGLTFAARPGASR